jgi:hypothetical protein
MPLKDDSTIRTALGLVVSGRFAASCPSGIVAVTDGPPPVRKVVPASRALVVLILEVKTAIIRMREASDFTEIKII